MNFWWALLGIIIVATAYEVYKPLGLALFVIALLTMFLAFKG